jgi:hypothetical protein
MDGDPRARFRLRSRHPGHELSLSPTQAKIAVVLSDDFREHVELLFGISEKSFESIDSEKCTAELYRFDDRTHMGKSSEQLGKMFLVKHRIGLADRQRSAQGHPLADCHARPYTGAPGGR